MNQVEKVSPGSIAAVGPELDRLRARRILLVTGKSSYAASGAREKLEPQLSGREVARFDGFSPNPDIEELRHGVELFDRTDPDAVLAVGGGSAMDMAKLVAFFGSTRLDPEECLSGVPREIPAVRPLVAAPTTAGSGSQATHFAVLYVGRTKHSVAHPSMLPRLAVVDSELTESQPAYLTACAGMDALSQAVESYWSIHSTERSRELAAEALREIVPNLGAAVLRPDASNRRAMALGAHRAGQAINLTKTTAPHAISYPLTAYYGIPHGHAVALTLPSLLRFNARARASDVSDPRGVSYLLQALSELARLLGADGIDDAAARIEELMAEISLETRLSALGLETDTDIETILDHGFNPQRVVNNPRRLTREALREILLEIR